MSQHQPADRLGDRRQRGKWFVKLGGVVETIAPQVRQPPPVTFGALSQTLQPLAVVLGIANKRLKQPQRYPFVAIKVAAVNLARCRLQAI